MAEQAKKLIDDINADTLELLRRRIESEVRTNFLKTVTLPIGGGGVAAIVIAVVLWIPNQVGSFLRQPAVQQQIDTTVEAQIDEYFDKESTELEIQKKIEEVTVARIAEEVRDRLPEQVNEKVNAFVAAHFQSPEGKQAVAEDVAKAVGNYLASAAGTSSLRDQVAVAVGAYLAGETGAKVVAEHIGRSVEGYFDGAEGKMAVREYTTAAVTTYFGGVEGRRLIGEHVPQAVMGFFGAQAGQEQVRQLVTEYLSKNPEGRELLVETINTALQPIRGGSEVSLMQVEENVLRNRFRLVQEFEQQSLLGTPKDSIEKLLQFIDSPNVQRIERLGQPVVLTKTISRDHHYADFAIEKYLKEFRRVFGPQFKYVAIQIGPDRKLIALVESERFAEFFDDHRSEVVELLNSGSEGAPRSEGDVRKQVIEWFGPDCTRAVPVAASVGRVLQDSRTWSHPERLDEEVAVVNRQRQLVATTSRRRLIGGLLDRKP